MKKQLADLITIDSSLVTPIYKQIVQSICKHIDNGTLTQNDKLPSVNSISERFALARGSVFTAYNDLRASGIIDSIPGKGYFVTSTQTKVAQKIFLLFSTFTAYKESLYSAIVQNLPENCKLDIYFHHHNKKLFETLIREQAPYYKTFVIMPEMYDEALPVLSVLDPRQVILLDVGYKEYKKHFAGVYQNSDKDIYSFLTRHKDRVQKYNRLFLVCRETQNTKDVIYGFGRFAKTGTVKTAIISEIDTSKAGKGDAYIVIEDDHLVELVRFVKSAKLKPGKDIGILSYNETNLKSVIGDGISTISPDFYAMGRCVAEMITYNKREVIENPFILVDRQSF